MKQQLRQVLCWHKQVDWKSLSDSLLCLLFIIALFGLAVVISLLIVAVPASICFVGKLAIRSHWAWMFLIILVHPLIGLIRMLCKVYDGFGNV